MSLDAGQVTDLVRRAAAARSELATSRGRFLEAERTLGERKAVLQERYGSSDRNILSGFLDRMQEDLRKEVARVDGELQALEV